MKIYEIKIPFYIICWKFTFHIMLILINGNSILYIFLISFPPCSPFKQHLQICSCVCVFVNITCWIYSFLLTMVSGFTMLHWTGSKGQHPQEMLIILLQYYLLCLGVRIWILPLSMLTCLLILILSWSPLWHTVSQHTSWYSSSYKISISSFVIFLSHRYRSHGVEVSTSDEIPIIHWSLHCVQYVFFCESLMMWFYVIVFTC